MQGPGQGSAANYLGLLCHPDLPEGVVALSDQDDVWKPHKLERALGQLAQAGPGPCAWSGRYMFTDPDLRPLHPSPVWLQGPSLSNAVVQNILSGHTLTLNPAALALIRRAGPQAVQHHDWWVYLVLMACGAQALVDTDEVLFYRQHGDNAMGGRSVGTARSTRMRMVLTGELRDWIEANLRALLQSDLPLTPRARAFSTEWLAAGRMGRLRLLHRFGIHRQTLRETALIWVAALSGRL